MTREIYCHKCGIYLGEIRDATLRKGIQYTCASCVTGNAKRRKETDDMLPPEFRSIFGF